MRKTLLFVFIVVSYCLFGQSGKNDPYLLLMNKQIRLLDSLCDQEGRTRIGFRAKKAELNYFSSGNSEMLHTIRIDYSKGNTYKTEVYTYDSQKLKIAYLSGKKVLVVWKKRGDLNKFEKIEMIRANDTTVVWTHTKNKRSERFTIKEPSAVIKRDN